MYRRCLALALVSLALALSACGGRPLAGGGDASPAPRPDVQPDGALPLVDAGPPALDTRCVRPPGYCHSAEECPSDQVCDGCHGDPCCPMCEVCLGKCVPLPTGTCASNADCPDGSFCEHDGLCVVTGGKAGTCKKRPVCGDAGACLGVCGCDGNTYCSACDAHEAGVSVAIGKACLAPTCAGLDQLYSAEIQKARSCCEMCAALQCTLNVTPLWCGCPTPVNAITPTMTALQAEYTARSCSFSMPPCGVKCAGSMPGYCGPGGVCMIGGD